MAGSGYRFFRDVEMLDTSSSLYRMVRVGRLVGYGGLDGVDGGYSKIKVSWL